MSRVHRIRRRRAGTPLATHDRARFLAAERLDEALLPSDSVWLADHLAECGACRAVAAAYESDRLVLRGDARPDP